MISRGVTQGNLISPTILHMVVDAVIQHWEIVVDGENTGQEGFDRAVKKLATLFYVENGLTVSPCTARLQEDLYVLMGLFDRVDLWINVEKTVGMVRKLYRTEGIHFDGGLYTEDGGVWMYLLGEA